MSASGFFVAIRNSHGDNVVTTMKQILDVSNRLASFNNRRIFLLQCRMKRVFPNHIINNIKCIYSLQEEEQKFSKEVSKILCKFRRSILNLEVKITICKIQQLNGELDKLWEQLYMQVEVRIFNNFRNRVDIRYNNTFEKIKNDNIKKINNLEEKYGRMNIKVCDKFLHNYTDVELPIEAKRILAAGPKMSIPLMKKEVSIPNIIKDVEYGIAVTDNTEQNINIMRSKAVNIITNFYNNINRFDEFNNLIRDYNVTKNFLKNNKNLYILNSDKGNSTVIMYKHEYITAMNNLLEDTNLYKKITKDPTTTFQNKAKSLINKLYSHQYISKDQRDKMIKSNTVAPKLYGMRKTHKPGLKMRPVVSCINTPAYNLAVFVHNTLAPYIRTFEFNVTNSTQLVNSIREVRVPPDYVLISLDVISLFTNIPKDLFIYIVKKEWTIIAQFTDIELDIFLEVTEFLFNSSYFKFNNSIYQQLDGTAMGNPASPCIANIVMNFLITQTLNKLEFTIPFFRLYVDDSILAVPKDKIDHVLYCFNSFNKKLQFTVEVENNNSIPFLDVYLVRNQDGTIDTDWYAKPTSSGRILNFLSDCPLQQKRNVILNMMNKIYNICSEQYIGKNIEKMKTMLKTNNYPTFFINRVINQYTVRHNRVNSMTSENNDRPEDNLKYIRLPFLTPIAYQLKSLFSVYSKNTKVIFYNVKKVHNLFTKLKDSDPLEVRSNIVYKINCKSCDTCYIGQTRQLLKNRLYQHRYDCRIININKKEKTALARHHFEEGNHNFEFENTKILDYEENWYKRNISEMIHIQLNDNSINFRTDTLNLNPMYMTLIHDYRNVITNNVIHR